MRATECKVSRIRKMNVREKRQWLQRRVIYKVKDKRTFKTDIHRIIEKNRWRSSMPLLLEAISNRVD
ncbi:hypothetical protein KIN20_018513 [Parelaphostrongylus tenuis]|uniref:Uncharacterized protein n=1 Tax=Parelaphostrongylus tenuis TaxID=148309 RepID=A0AAD5QRH0_PARTN|nr:hypothetical protein KIN20_018513 [Parelaphostrongylus tenuis]